MGCLIQIIIVAVCALVGSLFLPPIGTVAGALVGLWLIAKLNSR